MHGTVGLKCSKYVYKINVRPIEENIFDIDHRKHVLYFYDQNCVLLKYRYSFTIIHLHDDDNEGAN